MGALLESGMVGNIGLKHLRVIKEDTIKKWDDLGFLEGLEGHMKDNIAQLYENQASYLINEAAVSDSSGSFETVVFPIIRRVFSKLLANDIVSVQAMNLPIGKLFFFVPKIQERNSGAHYAPYGWPNTANAAGDGYSVIPHFSANSICVFLLLPDISNNFSLSTSPFSSISVGSIFLAQRGLNILFENPDSFFTIFKACLF